MLPRHALSWGLCMVALSPANPILVTQWPLVTEAQVTDSTTWVLELNYRLMEQLCEDTSVCPRTWTTPRSTDVLSISHYAGLVPWASYTMAVVLDEWEVLIRPSMVGSSAESPEGFFINANLDSVRVTYGTSGPSWVVPIRDLPPTQSLATRVFYSCLVPTQQYEWVKDNSPSIGAPNDGTNISGTVEGHVFSQDTVPVTGLCVHYMAGTAAKLGCTAVAIDDDGFYRIVAATQEELVLRIVDSSGVLRYGDTVSGVFIEPDSVQTRDIVVTGALATAKPTRPSKLASKMRVWANRRASGDVQVTLASSAAGGGSFVVTLFTLAGALVSEGRADNLGPGTYGLCLPRNSGTARSSMLIVRVSLGEWVWEQRVDVR